MKEYYFLASLLPTLEIGHVPGLGFAELQELLRVNVSEEDYSKALCMRRHIDIENMQRLWMGQPMDVRGNLSYEELVKALHDNAWSDTEGFPLYLIDFLNQYKTVEQRLAHYSALLSAFFENQKMHKGFLRQYFEFQKQWRLVLVGFRAKLLRRDLTAELQYEDPTEPIVAEILAQRDTPTYHPPFEFKELAPLFLQFQDNPLELHRALYTYQFQYLVEVWGGAFFTIDRILNYMARLILVERWLELDMQKGIEVIDQIERSSS